MHAILSCCLVGYDERFLSTAATGMEDSRPSSPMSVEAMISEDPRQIEGERSKNPDWRWKKHEAIANLEAHGDRCIVARDACTRDSRNVKQFASIPSSVYCIDLVRETKPSHRCFYECLYKVRLNSKCHILKHICLHVDVHHQRVPAPGPSKLKMSHFETRTPAR